MRRIFISLLLASALAPATAFARDNGPGREPRDRTERSSKTDDDRASPPPRPERVERAERPQRSEHSESMARANRAEGGHGAADLKVERPALTSQRGSAERAGRQERSQRADRVPRADREDRAERPLPVREQAAETPAEQPRQPSAVKPVVQPARRSQGGSDSLLDGFRRVARDEASGHDDDDHDGRDRDHDGRDRDHDGHDRDGHGRDHGGRDHDGHDRDHDHDWSKDWRNDHRYDWWDYRNRYRSIYRLGRYHDPYGWGYRRWSIGYNLWPSHYGSGYWLNDPWMYRLPPAYGPYRWVRYYDDALLVNIYTGQVIDVVYNFFW